MAAHFLDGLMDLVGKFLDAYLDAVPKLSGEKLSPSQTSDAISELIATGLVVFVRNRLSPSDLRWVVGAVVLYFFFSLWYTNRTKPLSRQ